MEEKITTIYISESRTDQTKTTAAKRIIDACETDKIRFLCESRDFMGSRLECKREATLSAEIVIVVLSDAYIDTSDCMYDVALAICFERHIIIIDKRKSHKNLPNLLVGHTRISRQKKFETVIQKLQKQINCFLNDNEAQMRIQTRHTRDKAQVFVRDVEREAGFDQEMQLQRQIRTLDQRLQQLLKEKKIITQIELVAEESNNANFESALRLRFEAEKSKRELKEKIRVLETRESSLNAQVNFLSEQNKNLSTRLKVMHEKTTDCEDVKTFQSQMNDVLIQISKIKDCEVKDTIQVSGQRMPSELRCFCQKYEKMIGPNIRRFGHLLHLSEEQLDEVEKYRHYGDTEMFWKTIQLWQPNMNEHSAFISMLNALEGIGVDIGGKPMSQEEIRVLHQKLPFILQNCYNLANLVLQLLSQHVLTEITEKYITEPKQDEERLLRLINVLTTKENGIKEVCDAFCRTNQKFIADEIMNALPKLPRRSFPVEKSDESSDSVSHYSSDDGKHRVAIVAPIYTKITSKANTCKDLNTDVPDTIEKIKPVDSTPAKQKGKIRHTTGCRWSCNVQ